MSCRLGIDVGGTFTDLLLFDESSGALHLHKTPSTPHDQSVGILEGIRGLLERAQMRPADIRALLHGTTVSTNIVLEEKGARVGLLVTQDFEQILHLARSQTPGPLAGWMIMQKPAPLADLQHTQGVEERMSARGEVLTPLDESQAQGAVQTLLDAQVESITISLLNAYANAAHEQRLKAIVNALAPDMPVSVSSEILPEFREYERTLVTVMNAYVRPAMRNYLANFETKLGELQVQPTVNIVRSDGGLMSVKRAADRPVHTMLSGPAGGVSGAAFIAGLAGHPNALGFDMGGTSTDVSLIRNGLPTISRQTALGYYPIKIPSVEVHSVGAGGGSIAHVPMTGALRVGPHSAGARPGPACYGHGGEEPTVTDANVVLGRLPPRLLDGAMALEVAAAESAVNRIATCLGLGTQQAAQGMVDIVNENMLGALRLVTVQKGLDPRDFALVAFGGAGPLHGNAIAMLAGCYPVIIPPTPGVLSALGFLYSDAKNEFAQTFIRHLETVAPADISAVLKRLGTEAAGWLSEEGIASGDQSIRYEADVRYFRQGYEVALEVRSSGFDKAALDELATRFGAAHERLYGFKLGTPVELVNLRAVGAGQVRKMALPRLVPIDADAGAAWVGHEQVYFASSFQPAAVYDRLKLRAGHQVHGPAIITQTDSTTLIHPHHTGHVDPYGSILILPAGERPSAQAATAHE